LCKIFDLMILHWLHFLAVVGTVFSLGYYPTSKEIRRQVQTCRLCTSHSKESLFFMDFYGVN
jgi:hypothetical protein